MWEDRSCHECFLQGLESFLSLRRSSESDILLKQSCEGRHYVTVFIDELFVEVGEVEEDLNIMLGL